MKKYICGICGYIYDQAKGAPETGVAPGTPWEGLPSSWVCPICGAPMTQFREENQKAPAKRRTPSQALDTEEPAELNALEMSALCSNLAKGCQKQYMPGEEALFVQLAEYFKAASAGLPQGNGPSLLEMADWDLDTGIPSAQAAAEDAGDRGAKRALVWSQKTTRMLRSLLERYETEGDAWLNHTGVYVCAICGFIYVGDNPPQVCPVCKVPNWKFEKIEGGSGNV